jgi:hypothetical protein
MLCVCALPDLIAFLRQNGVRFPPPPCATTCISPDFFLGGKRHSKLEKTHKSGQSNARNLCAEKKPRAKKAPIYGPSELLHFAEETILNARLLSNRKSNARKSEFRAFDYGRFWAGFRAIDSVAYSITFLLSAQYPVIRFSFRILLRSVSATLITDEIPFLLGRTR